MENFNWNVHEVRNYRGLVPHVLWVISKVFIGHWTFQTPMLDHLI